MYIGDNIVKCVHRLDVQGAVTQWDVNDSPSGLSANAAHNVLVTCFVVRKIKEFSSHGDLLRELTPRDVIVTWHAIQTRSGQFIVSHGSYGDPVHRVCMISAEGRHIVSASSRSKSPGSDTDQYKLSSTLEYVRQVGSSVFTCIGALGTPAERGPSLESIYRVSLTVDLCDS